MDFNEILQLAKEFLTCPVCGDKFDREQIHFRGFIDDKFVIQTECQRGHKPVSALFISSLQFQGNQQPLETEIVTGDDLLDLKLKLQDFNGDFEALFSKG